HAGAIPSCYTFNRRPLHLAFSQDFPTREEALASEQQVKGWSRKEKEAMMKGDWAEVSRLAQSTRAISLPSVHPEPVEGAAPSVHSSTSSERTKEKSR
ncbi:MAG: hypothetical protein R3B95_21415, partial [Nitrospirales bacterium]|nr:hypothetical protein [Nitrospirales bacterium]